MLHKAIRVLFIFVAAGGLMLAADPGQAFAKPASKDWCESRYNEMTNACAEQYHDDAHLVVLCQQKVFDWYAKCNRGEIEETTPCLCDIFGYAATTPGGPETFDDRHTTE